VRRRRDGAEVRLVVAGDRVGRFEDGELRDRQKTGLRKVILALTGRSGHRDQATEVDIRFMVSLRSAVKILGMATIEHVLPSDGE
jgi:hypothetical protein